MKNHNLYIFSLFSFVIFIIGCNKNRNECLNGITPIQPFVEKFSSFTCGGNLYEYEYIMRKKSQIDSLTDCTFSPPVAFPLDEKDMVYIMFSKLSYFSNDTFSTILSKDTCKKLLVYDIEMIQRDSIKVSFYPQGIARSMFCSVENIPPDYQVEVKYKYVPLQ